MEVRSASVLVSASTSGHMRGTRVGYRLWLVQHPNEGYCAVYMSAVNGHAREKGNVWETSCLSRVCSYILAAVDRS